MARRRARSDRGAAAVEFALVMIPLLYLVFGAISYAYMFSFRQTLSQAASEASRAAVGAPTAPTCAVTGPFTATTCPAQYAAAQAVQNSLSSYGMTCGTGALTCSITLGDSTVVTGCATGRTCVKVVVSYPYRSNSLLPTVPGFGVLLPSTLSFTSVVQVA